MSDEPAIVLERVTRAFGRTRAVDDLRLAVPADTVTVLLGPNGAGKTTLLRLAAGLLAPDAGTVRVLGLDPVKDRRALSERVGFVPDRPDAWGSMNVLDLHRFLAVHHPRWDAARARDLLHDLAVPTDRPFRAMSRGEGMKAMLASALAPDPEVLLLDEPFGGLDPLVHDEVLRAVVGALGGKPRTVLVSTHDLDVAARIGERVVVLVAGRVRTDLPMDEAAGTDPDVARREALKGVLEKAARGE